MRKIMVTVLLALLASNGFAAQQLISIETMEIDDQGEPVRGRGADVSTPSSRYPVTRKGGNDPLPGMVTGGANGGGSTIPSKPDVYIPPYDTNPYPQESKKDVGQIIAIAKDIVALGEDIYKLVQKGKPSNTTDFTPLAIVPRDPISKEIVDPFDMENCSMPVEKKFLTSIKSGAAEVVRFEYMVMYTYGCSYNGSGNYIQNAIVQPVSVKTSYGWDFNASMKLSGIMNHGTKASPVVGALLTIKYSMNSWRTAFEQNETIHITGSGSVKNYAR